MTTSEIVAYSTALSALLGMLLTWWRMRPKDVADTAKTWADREEVLSKVSLNRVEEANKMINKAWEIADRIEEDMKETRDELKRVQLEFSEHRRRAVENENRLQQELNDLRSKLLDREREIERLRNELKQFQPQSHGRTHRPPEGGH